jgi:hypothetical protein
MCCEVDCPADEPTEGVPCDVTPEHEARSATEAAAPKARPTKDEICNVFSKEERERRLGLTEATPGDKKAAPRLRTAVT